MVKKENSGIRTIIGLAVLGILLVAAVPLLAAITDGLDSEFDFSNRQLLYAYLGSSMQYENKIIELLDVIPEDFRDGLFMACYRLNTFAICCKFLHRFKLVFISL